MSYISSSDYIAYKRDASSDVSAINSALVDILIANAQTVIENYTGKVFQSTSDDVDTHYFDYNEDCMSNTLVLPEDVCSISSVKAGTTTIAASDYYTEPRNRTPYYALTLRGNSGKVWSDADSDGNLEYAIAITGNFAYSTTVPNDIKQAMYRLVDMMFDKASQSPSESQPTTILPSGITIKPSRLPEDVLDILEFYKPEIVV